MTRTEELIEEIKQIVNNNDIYKHNLQIQSKRSLTQHTLGYNSEQLDSESITGLAYMIQQISDHVKQASAFTKATMDYLFNVEESKI